MRTAVRWCSGLVAAAALVGCGGEPPTGTETGSDETETAALQGAPPAELKTRWASVQSVDYTTPSGVRFLQADADGAGNAIAVGLYRGPSSIGNTALPFPNPGTYLAVAKFDADGKVLWAKGFGPGTSGPNPSATIGGLKLLVSRQSHEIFLTGTLSGGSIYQDYPSSFPLGGKTLSDGSFIAKLSPSGQPVWARNTRPVSGREWFEITDLAAHPEGDVIALAQYPGASAAMVIRYASSTGEPSWTQMFGPTNPAAGNLQGQSIGVDEHGQIYLAGQISGTVRLASATYSVAPVEVQQVGIVARAPVMVALGPSGSVRWSRRLADYGDNVELDTRDGHLVALSDRFTFNGFVKHRDLISLDLSGGKRWSREVPFRTGQVHLGPYKEVTTSDSSTQISPTPVDPENDKVHVRKFDRVTGASLAVRTLPAIILTDSAMGYGDGRFYIAAEAPDGTDLGLGPMAGSNLSFVLQLSP